MAVCRQMPVVQFLYSPFTRRGFLAVPWHANFGSGDNQRHIHPVYHLMLILGGRGRIERDNGEHALQAGDLLIINPNELHVLRADSEAGLTFYSLSFYLLPQEALSGPDIDGLNRGAVALDDLAERAETTPLDQLFALTALEGKTSWPLPDALKARLMRVIMDYEPLFSAVNPYFKRFWLDPQTRDKAEFARLTHQMLTEWLHLLDQAGHEANIPDDVLQARICGVLDGMVYGRYSHQAVKAQLNYNPVYLAGYFKEKTGLSPRAYVDRQKIRQACSDLHQTSDSVEAIASRLGYSSTGHFCTNFKKIMHMTPSQYREATQQ